MEYDTHCSLDSSKVINEYNEAISLGVSPKRHLTGLLTFLSLSQTEDGSSSLAFINRIISIYRQLLEQTATLDDEIYIQFDEPVLSQQVDDTLLSHLQSVYTMLASISNSK